MSPTEGILCAIIVCLIVYMAYKAYCDKKTALPDTPSAQVESMRHGPNSQPTPRMRVDTSTPEQRALRENYEHFTDGRAPASTGDDMIIGTYSPGEFGGTGMDFKDWVASQAVDPQVLKNHSEFVKDRLGDNNQNVTGRTYAMGEVEGTDQVPWVGIRGRPQAVATYNPTQVPDVDMRNFTTKPRFNWNSSV